MRKLCKWWLLTVVLFVGAGCSDDDGGEQVKLAFSKRTAVFDAAGGNLSVNVAAAGAWSVAEPKVDWLMVQFDQKSIQIHAEANPTPETRQAEISVTTGDYSAVLSVIQESAAGVTLDVKGPADYVFDSEGGKILLSVKSNAAWQVAVDNTWCEVETDNASGVVTLRVTAPNTGDSRLAATMSVTAGDQQNGKKMTFELAQQMRSENPYFRIAGSFSIYAGKWLLKNTELGAGTRGSWVIADDVYNESYGMTDLTFEGPNGSLPLSGLMVQLPYDREERTVSIPLGQRIASLEEKDMDLYLVLINAKAQKFSTASGSLTGLVSEDFKTISLKGLPADYPTLGLISRKISDSSQIGMFSDIYYPTGDGIALKRQAVAASPVYRAASFSSVLRGEVVRIPARTTGAINRLERYN